MANRLYAEDRLLPGEMVGSNDGRFSLVMQGDGNLVLYRNGSTRALWATGTHGRKVAFAIMQSDGNFVVYAPDGTPLWDAETYGNPGTFLQIQDDGNLVLYAPGDKAIWNTHTNETGSEIDRTLILGIWGRAGGDGVPGLIKELTPRLTALGVPANNIFSMSWNPDHNDNPFETPDTNRHLAEINARTAKPSYVAIIGHSYGGWAACRLSRRLQPVPNFVALIDPVFGPNGDHEQIVQPYGANIHNWYQRNSITEPTVVEDCTGTVFGCPEGVSCGRSIPGINNHEVQWRRDWNGNRMRRGCPGGRKPRHSFHLNIDSDRHVWRQIIEQIETQVQAVAR